MNLFGNASKFYARALITTRENQHVGFICAVYKEPYRISEEKLDLLLSDAGAHIVGKIEMENLSTSKKLKKKKKLQLYLGQLLSLLCIQLLVQC